jgi:hypothetical protein
MISNDKEMQATLARIQQFQTMLAQLRGAEKNPQSYHTAADGFLAEIDRLQLEVRAYLSLHPKESRTP